MPSEKNLGNSDMCGCANDVRFISRQSYRKSSRYFLAFTAKLNNGTGAL